MRNPATIPVTLNDVWLIFNVGMIATWGVVNLVIMFLRRIN